MDHFSVWKDLQDGKWKIYPCYMDTDAHTYDTYTDIILYFYD